MQNTGSASAGRAAEQLELSCLLTGTQTGTDTQENSLAVSYTFKHILTIRPNTTTYRHSLEKEFKQISILLKHICL